MTRCLFQVDNGDLGRALQRMQHRIKQFIRDDSQKSVLIHNRKDEGLSVWLEAPHGAEISNSFSFSKKDGMKPNPSFWGLSLTTMSGVPEGMKVLTEDETADALKNLDVSTPLASPSPRTPGSGYGTPTYSGNFDPNAAAFPAPQSPMPVERAKESIPVAKLVPKPKKEKEGPEFQGTWADDDDEDEGGALVLDIPLPPPKAAASEPAEAGGAPGDESGGREGGRSSKGGEHRRGRDKSEDLKSQGGAGVRSPGQGGRGGKGTEAKWGDLRSDAGASGGEGRGGGRGGRSNPRGGRGGGGGWRDGRRDDDGSEARGGGR